MEKFKVQMKLSIFRQYEVDAVDEDEAKEIAAEMSCKDMSNCDEYEFENVTEY